ncbi:Similar to LINE-1 reverse transcriptase homolog; acc. no. P08548 [Pyronema omphalodes CBS 100304]|uniref:Similar to LINE-1 reverse transcriptase homolog acc. no. P08548 n=1 Tax=Pyronema omphalodes (strain CBS 100304) TaxID=1076935 RepID=U4L3M4_PYROM|nr:Similar to LINE-1 reverse transcriptase homolog; acc. no. P08548 [Pyronema omphalodes CBS 100304]
MPGKSYFDHVKHAQLLIDYARLKDKHLYLVLLDQEKAYDRIDHGFLWKTLEQFGVPIDIIRAIQGCYSQAKSVVSINKFTSETFDVKSGVRQGDPLPCLLFNAVIETLALRIIEEPRLGGFLDENDIRHILDLYADDMAVTLTDLNQMKALLHVYKIYAKASGSTLNIQKTEIIGALDSTHAMEYRGIKVYWLGFFVVRLIELYYDQLQCPGCEFLNWDTSMSNVTKIEPPVPDVTLDGSPSTEAQFKAFKEKLKALGLEGQDFHGHDHIGIRERCQQHWDQNHGRLRSAVSF